MGEWYLSLTSSDSGYKHVKQPESSLIFFYNFLLEEEFFLKNLLSEPQF